MLVILNFESELEDVILNTLCTYYQLNTTDAFDFFLLRFKIEHYNIKYTGHEELNKIIAFLLNELNLPLHENKLIYKDVELCKGLGVANSLKNIIETIMFRQNLISRKDHIGNLINYKQYIQDRYREILQFAQRKASPYKNAMNYISCVKHYALDCINKQYRTKPSHPPVIDGFYYPISHNYFARTLEEIYQMDVLSSHLKVYNTSTITEKDLEDYLVQNLSALEEGLRFVDRQYVIEECRIDILASDKNNNPVIIELKITEDKSLVFQSIYYPLSYKKSNKKNHVRMIVVSPSYSDGLLTALREVGGVEIFKYDPIVELGKIKSLQFKKIS